MENETEILLLDANDIKRRIFTIRGKQVMLDTDLAELYQIQTKAFNQSVNRNIERFPERFRFRLTKEEYTSLRSQFVTSNGRGGRRYMPFVFTEQAAPLMPLTMYEYDAINKMDMWQEMWGEDDIGKLDNAVTEVFANPEARRLIGEYALKGEYLELVEKKGWACLSHFIKTS